MADKKSLAPAARNNHLDNLKGLLIFLVVFEHVIRMLLNSLNMPAAIIFEPVSLLINAFHMPLFIFISGYLLKSAMRRGGKFALQKSLRYLLLYLFLFLILYVLSLLESSNNQALNIFYPPLHSWYLLVFVIWIPVLYIIRKLHPAITLSAAFLLAVIFTCFSSLMGNMYISFAGTFLSLERLIIWFPFFLAGFHLPEAWLHKLMNSRLRWHSLIIAVVILGILAGAELLKPGFFYSLTPQQHMPVPLFLIYFASTALLAFAVALIAPMRRVPVLEDIGRRTLQIYFWHFPFIMVSELIDPELRLVKMLGAWGSLALFSVVLTLGLAWKPFGVPFELLKKVDVLFLKAYDAAEKLCLERIPRLRERHEKQSLPEPMPEPKAKPAQKKTQQKSKKKKGSKKRK